MSLPVCLASQGLSNLLPAICTFLGTQPRNSQILGAEVPPKCGGLPLGWWSYVGYCSLVSSWVCSMTLDPSTLTSFLPTLLYAFFVRESWKHSESLWHSARADGSLHLRWEASPEPMIVTMSWQEPHRTAWSLTGVGVHAESTCAMDSKPSALKF